MGSGSWGGQHDVDVRMTMGRSLGGLPRGEGKGGGGGGGGGQGRGQDLV